MQRVMSDIEIDDEADAAYVRVAARPVARTQEVAEGVLVDFDADEQITGVEVLDLGKRVGTGDRVSYLNGLVAGLLLRPIGAAAE